MQVSAEVLSPLGELDAATREPTTGIDAGDHPVASMESTIRSDEIQSEILEWAKRQLNEQETVSGLREIRETGGLELVDFLHDLER